MKYYFTILFSLILINTSTAESQTDTILLPNHIIKFTPFNLLDFNTPAIQFSYERKLQNNAAYQLELGYLNKFFYPSYIVNPVQGYRAKFELRRYEFGHSRSRSKSYIGGMVLIKQAFKEKERTFDRFNGAYRQQFKYQEISTGGGIYFTMGKQFFFKDRTSLEIGFAAGLRYVYIERGLNDIPADAVIEAFQLTDLEPGSYAFPSFFPVLKLGYCIP